MNVAGAHAADQPAALALMEMRVFGEGRSRSSPRVLAQLAGLPLHRVCVCLCAYVRAGGHNHDRVALSYTTVESTACLMSTGTNMHILYNLHVMSEPCSELQRRSVQLRKWKKKLLCKFAGAKQSRNVCWGVR